MMTIIPKWKVTIMCSTGQLATFKMSDQFASNVMRAVAAMEFGDTIQKPVTAIMIEREPGS